MGNLSENVCPGVGHLCHYSSRIQVNIIPFSIFHLKNMPIYIAIDISIKNIFNTVKKIPVHVVFALSLPYIYIYIYPTPFFVSI